MLGVYIRPSFACRNVEEQQICINGISGARKKNRKRRECSCRVIVLIINVEFRNSFLSHETCIATDRIVPHELFRKRFAIEILNGVLPTIPFRHFQRNEGKKSSKWISFDFDWSDEFQFGEHSLVVFLIATSLNGFNITSKFWYGNFAGCKHLPRKYFHVHSSHSNYYRPLAQNRWEKTKIVFASKTKFDLIMQVHDGRLDIFGFIWLMNWICMLWRILMYGASTYTCSLFAQCDN